MSYMESKFREALVYAAKKHHGTFRQTSKLPYIVHPIRVASILKDFGYTNENMLVATILHDVVEDTSTSISEIEERFGKEVANFVDEVSRPENMKKNDWLENFTMFSDTAKIIKMADRIDNLLDSIGSFKEGRRLRYYKQTKIIIRVCGEVNVKMASKLTQIIEKNK